MVIKSYFMPDFVELQRKSYFRLLEKGLIEEISKRNPITNRHKGLELRFYPEFYKLMTPKWNPQKAILYGQTYSAKLFVPVQIKSFKTKQIVFKWALLCDFPLMTKRGHFLVNGISRVIINQVIRGPGIYYNKITKTEETQSGVPLNVYRYYADFISMRGYWLRISVDMKNRFWAEMKKTPKIPLLWFLLGFGLDEKKIIQSIQNSSYLLDTFRDKNNLSDDERKKYYYINTTLEAQKNIYLKVAKPKKNDNNILPDLGRQWLYKRFMNPRTYDLSVHGRLCLNRKLGLSFPRSQRTLTPHDILFATDLLIKQFAGLGKTDDIDNLKNKRVRTSSDLIQLQIGIGLVRLEKIIRDKMWNFKLDSNSSGPLKLRSKDSLLVSKDPSSKSSINNVNKMKKTSKTALKQKELNKTKKKQEKQSVIALKKTSENTKTVSKSINKKTLSSFITNKPLNYFKMYHFIDTKALNGALREFFGTSPLSQFMDQINPLAEITHKRRLTSLGPSGVSEDTATMAVRGIHPTHYGRICPVETPEGKNAGLVNTLTTFARVNFDGGIETPFMSIYKGQRQKKKGLIFLSPEHEENIIIAAGDLAISKAGFLPNGILPVRKINEFSKIKTKHIHFVAVSPNQMISVATSLVPFLEHDDANRALMGANMQRQAVPLARSEQPIVGTGLEAKVISDSGRAVQAKFAGFVGYTSANKIIVYTFQ
nr:RNA polymerase beta subunit protein a [Chaetopeltis orbicularis]